MLFINLKSRFKNEAFWLGTISWIIIISQLCGFDATTIIPKNYVNIFNAIFGFLGFLGVSVDTSTPGISDKVISTVTVAATNESENTKQEVQTENSTTSINSEVSENSQEVSTEEATVINTATNSSIPR